MYVYTCIHVYTYMYICVGIYMYVYTDIYYTIMYIRLYISLLPGRSTRKSSPNRAAIILSQCASPAYQSCVTKCIDKCIYIHICQCASLRASLVHKVLVNEGLFSARAQKKRTWCPVVAACACASDAPFIPSPHT